VYLGSQLLAVQQGGVFWMHEDPVTKSKRVTNSAGTVVSTIELDPWGADTNRSNNGAFQPRKFTSYTRDNNGSDEAMFRRSNRWHSRFDQPDPYDGSYSLADPQSFNRYAYVGNDPVNLVDPSGLNAAAGCPAQFSSCGGGGDSGSGFRGSWADDGGGGWGGGGGGGMSAGEAAYVQRLQNTYDAIDARRALNNGNLGVLTSILNGNQNVGLSVNGATLWGAQAGGLVTVAAQITLAQMPASGTGFYTYGRRGEQHGALQVIADLIAFSAAWSQSHPNNPIGIGNISNGTPNYRSSHRDGYAVDIRPMNMTGAVGNAGTTAWNRRDGTYNQALTGQLIQGLLGLTSVTRIIFNDPAFFGPRVGPDRTGVHDNHLHVSFRR